MSLGNFFKSVPSLRPMLNIGCLMDIPTGRYRKGKHGEHILNGGLSYLTGIGGMGNSYKSTLGHFMLLRSLSRHLPSHANINDTEISLTMDRLEMLCWDMDNIGEGQLEDSGRLVLTDKVIQPANEWFSSLREFLKEKRKQRKDFMAKTPFLDKSGKNIEVYIPSLFEIDSLSQMDFDVVLTMQEKNEVGSSGLNMEAMKAASAKSQMLNQLPGLTGAAGAYIIMTAHIGEEHQIDQYSPPKKKLAFLKGKLKFKNVPEKFTFLTNNCWYVTSTKPLQNQGTKGVEYPKNKDDVVVGDTDLNIIQLLNLRAKSGPSGMPFELIVSQSEGVLVGLSEFNYIKNYGRFGLGGHDRNYFLELRPEVALQRTTIRGKLAEDPLLSRAMEITSELCQMKNLWHDLDPTLPIEPKQLYEAIKDKGYDWDILLNTRGWWTFEGFEPEGLPFLSTMDLLLCAKGEYHPYWYDDVVKKQDKTTNKKQGS